jgi:hypothetical protein
MIDNHCADNSSCTHEMTLRVILEVLSVLVMMDSNKHIHFGDLGLVKSEANALSSNLSGVDDIVEDSIVNSSQGAASWALLLLDGVVASWLAEDASLSNDQHVLTAELLLELVHKSGLELAERRSKAVGDEDDDGRAIANWDLLGAGNVEVGQLELRVGLKIEEGLGNCVLELSGLTTLLLDLLGICEGHCDY